MKTFHILLLCLLLLWLLIGLHSIQRTDIGKIERQNMETGARFLQWIRTFGESPGEPFGPEELDEYWHGDFLHPNLPVILMTLAGGCRDALSIERMRFVPLLFGLSAVLLLVLWTGRQGTRSEAWAVGILLLLFPHILRKSITASTATAVALIWIALLWILSRPNKTNLSWILAGVIFGVGLGTKITILLLPISYGIARFAFRATVKDPPKKPHERSASSFEQAPGRVAEPHARRCQPAQKRMVRRWGLFLMTGLVVHVALWPWLWRDPIGNMYRHIMENRLQADTGILFFGEAMAKPPFFYPLWFLLMTVPLPLIVLFVMGLLHIVRRKLWKEHFAIGLHFWTMILFLCIFCFPVKSSLNGAEYFLPAFFSMATISAYGIAFLTGTDRFEASRASTRIMFLCVAVTMLSMALNGMCSGGLFTLRNAVGTVLGEPFHGAF